MSYKRKQLYWKKTEKVALFRRCHSRTVLGSWTCLLNLLIHNTNKMCVCNQVLAWGLLALLVPQKIPWDTVTQVHWGCSQAQPKLHFSRLEERFGRWSFYFLHTNHGSLFLPKKSTQAIYFRSTSRKTQSKYFCFESSFWTVLLNCCPIIILSLLTAPHL